MKATIDKDGNLTIEVGSLIESMSDRDLRTLAKYAVFQEYLLKGVCEALAEGTMFSDDEEQPWWFGGDTFNELRLRIAPLMPDITAQAVRHCEREMRQARLERNAYRDACWKLQREWHASKRDDHCYSGEYERPMTQEQAREYLQALEARLPKEVA